jgi:hypothetical protein
LPADFLLPLFAVVLLANAFLVAAAIHGLRRGEGDRARSFGTDRPPMTIPPAPRAAARPTTDELARAIAARRSFIEDAPRAVSAGPAAIDESPAPAAFDEALAEPAQPLPIVPAPAGRARIEPRGDDVPEGRAPEAAPPADVPPTPPKASRRRRATRTERAGATNAGAGRTEPGGTMTRGGDAGPAGSADERPTLADNPRRSRRRFSLPPLDDDHERVNRSIESFLDGPDSGAADEPVTADPPSAGATTVAFVAVDDGAPGEASAMVERTIRGAARGTDIVTAAGRGRFRIVLPGTGELAARAYLRRIRATLEPLLGTAERPVSFVVATATALDEPIEEAIGRAERRLGAALEAARRAADRADADDAEAEADDPAPAPRSAVD